MSNESLNSTFFLNTLLSMLSRKVHVPGDFPSQVREVKRMQKDDVSGLVDSLTDFSVHSASVDFKISTDNENFTAILNEWLETINEEYLGKIPAGIGELAKEYLKERWKYSSFPILKIAEFKEIDGILVPNKMFFVDGGSVWAKDKDASRENLDLFSYDYYLGKNNPEKLGEGVIITKPFNRWFEKFPTPFLVKRGVLHNWKIIEALKNKETEILEQIIPYMLLIQKGTEALALNRIKQYTNDDLQKVINDMKDTYEDMKQRDIDDKEVKTFIRASQFDEVIKHLIPDLSTIFNKDLFVQAERNILTGLGFVDIVEATSTSRRESILNPKGFIEEVKAGVEDFKNHILKPLITIIKQKNEKNRKYTKNTTFYITNSPVKSFMTDDFKRRVHNLWTAGRLSDQTAIELIAEVDFNTEVFRKKKETKDGMEHVFYPPVTKNDEEKGIDFKEETPKDENSNSGETSETNEHKHTYTVNEEGDGETSEVNGHKHEIIDFEVQDTDGHTHQLMEESKTCDKKKKEKKKKAPEYSDDLEGAPYKTIKDLPKQVSNNMSADLQRTFLTVFNRAYEQYQNDTRAFRIAWSVIRRIGRKNKQDIWVRKRTRTEGKLKPLKLSRTILEEAIAESEKELVDETLQDLNLEIAQKKKKLLDKLLNNKDENL